MIKNAIVLFIAAAVILAVFLPSYTRLQDLRRRNADYAQQIEYLKEKNARMRREKHLLEQDPAYLEKVAREKMGLVREGEVIYRIVPAPQAGE